MPITFNEVIEDIKNTTIDKQYDKAIEALNLASTKEDLIQVLELMDAKGDNPEGKVSVFFVGNSEIVKSPTGKNTTLDLTKNKK